MRLVGMSVVLVDLLEDLTSARTSEEALVVAATLWREAGDLLLGGHRRWSGSGKWLLREIRMFDGEEGTDHANALAQGLRSAAQDDREPMKRAVNEILDQFGGRVFDGFQRSAPP
jgi:hypothetical protein